MVSDSNDAQLSASVTYFEAYSAYSKKIAAWFVAYGVGFLVLILSHEHLLQLIHQAPQGLLIIGFALLGAVAQALYVLLYKWVLLLTYVSKTVPELQDTRFYRSANWVLHSFWFAVLFDVLTLAAYAIATFLALAMLHSASGQQTA